jgi:uncharacterized protein (DUF433 family)
MAYRVKTTTKAKRDLDAILARLLSREAGEPGLRWFQGLREGVASLAHSPQRCVCPSDPLAAEPGYPKLEMSTDMEEYVQQRDGGYYVAGTRIALDSVVHPFKNGASPESILRSFPLIGSLENVYGAITFYLAHKDEVEAYLRDQERLSQELAANQSPLPRKPLEKVATHGNSFLEVAACTSRLIEWRIS